MAERGGVKTSMTASLFIDTSPLVCAFDISQPEKQGQAADLLNEIGNRQLGAVSTHVMAEVAEAITHNLILSLSADRTYQRVEELLGVWEVLVITPQILLEAVRGMRDHKLSMRDAQVWAAARAYGLSVVLTEEFSDASEVEGVRFLNPFSPGFDLEAIIAA
jgi:predicted nucleic acid-binding protein